MHLLKNIINFTASDGDTSIGYLDGDFTSSSKFRLYLETITLHCSLNIFKYNPFVLLKSVATEFI